MGRRGLRRDQGRDKDDAISPRPLAPAPRSVIQRLRGNDNQGALMKEIVILGGARTPIGSFPGTLSSLAGPTPGSAAIKCALQNSALQAEELQQVIMGNVLQAAIGQDPARLAWIGADTS